MVVKMMKWSPWTPVSESKKFQVKIMPLKLEGFNGYEESEEKEGEEKGEKVVVVEMKWRGPKVGLVSLRRPPSKKQRRDVSTPKIVKRGEVLEWIDEFESVCNFSISQKDNSFNPWDISFNLLIGRKTEPINKLAVMGTVSLNLAELVSQMEPQIERKLPIALQVAGVASEATLLISVSFVEIRSSQELPGIVHGASVADKEDGFFRRVKDLTSYVSKSRKKKKKTEKKGEEDEEGETSDDRALNMYSGNTDESATFDSEGSPDNELGPTPLESLGYSSTGSTLNCETVATEDESSSYYSNGSVTQLGTSPSSETRLDSVSKGGFLSWKKRKLGFGSTKGKEEPLKTNGDQSGDVIDSDRRVIGPPSKDHVISIEKNGEEDLTVGNWEEKELISRDGQAKLKANVFFASIDQRSEKAAGESACTALVAVVADWLQSNKNVMPTISEFDSLITEGSSEWRKLCENEAYIQHFPDKHFDLETVLQADLRPLSVKPEKSFVGFFCPENFESLKDLMSFDDIWEEISSNVKDGEKQVYIVSWNDHFFVLKVEGDAYYIIDTLGERLFEGCNRAYILKFDGTASMYRLPEKGEDGGSKDMAGAEMEGGSKSDGDVEVRQESDGLVCSGKECCREFIKRFLAAIPLRELEMEEKKGTVSSVHLHQRLQIDFHFCSSSSSSS